MSADDAHWRPMRHDDLPAVMALADRIHPGLPEDACVFANRIDLFAPGCIVLPSDAAGGVAGYGVAHPIRRDSPPLLNTVLQGLDPGADAFYLHDVVVAPERRGRGEARAGVRLLLAQGAGFAVSTLISVYGTTGFWAQFGFEAADQGPMRAKLAAYGPDAVYMTRRNGA